MVYSLQPIACGDCCQPYECGLHCECPRETACCNDGGEGMSEAEYQAKYSALVQTIAQATDNPALKEKLEAELNQLVAAHDKNPPKPQHARGGCACLCEHLTELEIGAECSRLWDVGDCARADLGHGVSLACLTLARDKCGRWALNAIKDACGPRRLVKRNDLLFDLINGCDLTRIVDTGWKDWHRHDQPAVPFEDFAEAFGWTRPRATPANGSQPVLGRILAPSPRRYP